MFGHIFNFIRNIHPKVTASMVGSVAGWAVSHLLKVHGMPVMTSDVAIPFCTFVAGWFYPAD